MLIDYLYVKQLISLERLVPNSNQVLVIFFNPFTKLAVSYSCLEVWSTFPTNYTFAVSK